MNTGFRTLSIPFRSIHRLIQSVLPQLRFSFYRHQLLCADFSGGQITSDAGLLPLRSFDQRHRLTSDWAARLSDPRQDDRVRHDSLALLRQRIYQIVAGYEDANDAGRLRHDPLLQIVADQRLGHTLGSQPTLSRWENSPSGRDLVRLNDTWREQFIHLCGDEVRERGEILLDLDSTDDPTHGQQQLSFFNCVFQQRAQSRQKQLKRRYRRTQVPQRSFSSFRHRARSWSHQRRICYKAEHSAAGTNLRFVVTNCAGRASEIFAFYNDRGECENRIEEFKNGFRADRLSCHRFLANAFRLLLHGASYNLVNFFRLQLPQPWRSAQIETLRAQLFKICARVRQTARCIRFHLASGCPFQHLFPSVSFAVNSG